MSLSSIAIVDFGSQYTHLIRRCVMELGVEAKVFLPSTSADSLASFSGVILSGGPSSVYDSNSPRCDPNVFSLPVPILGICYGHQLMAHHLGGSVVPGHQAEYGKAFLNILTNDTLFKGLAASEPVWMSHGDQVVEPPSGFVVLASTESCPVAAMADLPNQRFGVQFHPEVDHTVRGVDILRNFILGACGCTPTLTTEGLLDGILDDIRTQVGDRKVFLLLSGGVDSTVAFLLLAKALGEERVYGLHIDTGLLREGETARITASLAAFGIISLHIVDASDEFLGALKGIMEPEEKRKAVAYAFLRVKDTAMADLDLTPTDWLMGQGTIYPDMIASGVTAHSHTIKTHHNSLLSERETLEIVEPLKLLYKDEVRRIGSHLGLPDDFVWKEPFPGPGLSIRILGEVTASKLELQRSVDAIMEECLRPTPWFRALWHRFPVLAVISERDEPVVNRHVLGTVTTDRTEVAEKCNDILVKVLEQHRCTYDDASAVLLPLKTVGVKGDMRSYDAPVAICVRHQGTWAKLPYNVLEQLSFELAGSVRGINRVVYDLSPSDNFSRWDVLTFMRLITSRDAMTADWAKLEPPLLGGIVGRIVSETAVDRVFLDITQKPPSMMEWE